MRYINNDNEIIVYIEEDDRIAMIRTDLRSSKYAFDEEMNTDDLSRLINNLFKFYLNSQSYRMYYDFMTKDTYLLYRGDGEISMHINKSEIRLGYYDVTNLSKVNSTNQDDVKFNKIIESWKELN